MNRREAWKGMNWIRQEKRLAIYLRDSLQCVYCGKTVEDGIRLSLDHIIPVELGGKNDERNLVTCCIPCNDRKNHHWWFLFLIELHPCKEDYREALKRLGISQTTPLDTYLEAAKTMIERRGSARRAVQMIRRQRKVLTVQTV